MTERHTIRVEVKAQSQGTRVYLDDQEIEGLRAVMIRAAVDEPATVILEFVARAVEIIGEVGKIETYDLEDKTQWRNR